MAVAVGSGHQVFENKGQATFTQSCSPVGADFRQTQAMRGKKGGQHRCAKCSERRPQSGQPRVAAEQLQRDSLVPHREESWQLLSLPHTVGDLHFATPFNRPQVVSLRFGSSSSISHMSHTQALLFGKLASLL